MPHPAFRKAYAFLEECPREIRSHFSVSFSDNVCCFTPLSKRMLSPFVGQRYRVDEMQKLQEAKKSVQKRMKKQKRQDQMERAQVLVCQAFTDYSHRIRAPFEIHRIRSSLKPRMSSTGRRFVFESERNRKYSEIGSGSKPSKIHFGSFTRSISCSNSSPRIKRRAQQDKQRRPLIAEKMRE